MFDSRGLTEYRVYYFVVDTTDHAGNFEREMTAWVTGRVGECEVGKEAADEALAEAGAALRWTERAIAQVPDEHGCHRPALIMPTPGWVNTGGGDCYPEAEVPAGSPRHPAYLSVAMAFERPLKAKEVKQLVERSRSFLTRPKRRQFDTVPERILGFRLLEEVRKQHCLKELDEEGRPVS